MNEQAEAKELHASLLAEVNRLCVAQNWERAEPVIRQLIAAGDKRACMYNALGMCLVSTARNAEGIRAFRKALLIDPMLVDARSHLIMQLDTRVEATQGQVMLERHRWWKTIGEPQWERRQPHLNDPDPERPLRVGYLGGDFRLHSAAFIYGWITVSHTPAIVPVLYSTLEHHLYDPTTDFYQSEVEWHDVLKMSDDELYQQIIDDKIDVLVDLSGFTHGARTEVFCRKPAPVQVTAWGYAIGTGLPCMDALFSDPITVSEAMRKPPMDRVIDLPCALGYDMPPYEEESYRIDVNERPIDAPMVFGVFQRACKVDDKALRAWAEILHRLPGASIVMKSGTYNAEFKATAKRVMGDEAYARLDFRGITRHQDNLRAHLEVDLCLDGFAQTGGTTTLEALWMGVPTLTLLGERPGQRIGSAILHACGVDGFSAKTVNEYVDLAVKWGTSGRGELASLRQNLRGTLAASPICKGYNLAVEAAYRTLWREWCLKARP